MINLKEVVKKYPNCLENREKLRSILLDLYPNEKLNTNVVLLGFDAGIHSVMQNKKSFDEVQTASLISKVMSEFGLQAVYAAQCIEWWADAFDVSVKIKSEQAFNSSPTNTEIVHSESSYMHPEVVIGNSSDYELKCIGDDKYAISKFLGFDESNMIIPNVIDGKMITKIGNSAFKECRNLKNLIISEGIITIGESAFENCDELKSVKFGNGLKTIEKRAFSNCSKLIEIDFPNSLTIIGADAFANCMELTTVNFSDNLEVIEHGAFSNCGKLSVIRLPNSCKKIEDSAFYFCISLVEANLNEGLIELGSRLFNGCSQLKRIRIPSTVQTISGELINRLFINRTTLYCYAGSKGLEYAKENGYKVANAIDW